MMPAGLSSSPLPKKKANCMIIEATLAKKLATVMISTSRFLMWASSWAITPSSSAGESVFMMPVVAHTVAFFWDRPSANALGTGVSATAIFGLGRSAWMQSRSIIACRPGACSGETSLAPIEASASLSEVNSCSSARPPMTTAMMAAPAPAASSAPAKATYSSPSRNIVTSIRNWRPGSRLKTALEVAI